jgi:hypothetical protein
VSTAREDRSDAGSTDGSGPPRTRYDIRVSTAVIPALVASFPVRATAVVVPRRAVFRLRVSGHQDIADVVRRLVESGLEVVEVRAHRSAPSPELTAPAPVAGGSPTRRWADGSR